MKDYQFLIITGVLLGIQSNGEIEKAMIAMTGAAGLGLITVGIINGISRSK